MTWSSVHMAVLKVGRSCSRHQLQSSRAWRNMMSHCAALKSSTTIVCAAGIMRSASTVLTARTNERLDDLIPRLNKVSGLPVVDANNRVIGVISRKVSE